MFSTTPPCPADLSHLRPTNREGGRVVALAALWTAGAVWLSLHSALGWWALGQIGLAAAFVQWFVILHEAGHDTLFRNRRLNTIAGTLAGIMALIPYRCWRRIHGRHHKWTGWQDLDPTTESLVPRQRGFLERTVVNTCWRLWIPLFSVMYRIQNHWNLYRLAALFPRPSDRRAMRRDVITLLTIYGALALLAGPLLLLRTIGMGVFLSLMAEDLLLLSQHTHVPQHVSDGKTVRPFPAVEQGLFTRSLRLPPWASRWLLHFDAHELHHMYPFVPGYHLRQVPLRAAHEVGWWQWITGAKRLKGEDFLFDNRLHTGWDL